MSAAKSTIGQKQDINLHQEASASIHAVNNLLCSFTDSVLQNFAISRSWYYVLRILRAHHPIPLTKSQIFERMLFQRSDVFRIVYRLNLAGYVVVNRNIAANNVSRVSITEKGLHTLSAIDMEMNKMLKPVGCLSDKEVLVLNELLSKILDRNNIEH